SSADFCNAFLEHHDHAFLLGAMARVILNWEENGRHITSPIRSASDHEERDRVSALKNQFNVRGLYKEKWDVRKDVCLCSTVSTPSSSSSSSSSIP
ncbi:hypothetical protein, partial [Thiolapillus sp.]|uniref:hypothetical protein n=1 Tax=Thiolapillus sp. TaxID=2017437 RepID=UPI003AF63B74